jgi:hypothetical protein
LAAILLLLAASVPAAADTDPVVYSRRSVGGVHLRIIDADLNDRRVVVSPAIAARGIGHSEKFASYLRRLQPMAAVNGTFFDKRTLQPVADILIGGKLVNFGGIGTALAFAEDGVDVIRLPKSRRVDWSEHRSALAGGPLLVWNGFAKPMPGGEGFGDPHVFARAAPRTAVGVTKDNHLLLVTTARGASLGRLAQALRDLGAVYAFNLDGGSSAAMYRRGRLTLGADRRLTNVLAVYVKPDPVSLDPLRPPGGLDWREGHEPRPVLHFAAGDLKVTVRLPRRWSEKQTISVTADKPLPDGWRVICRLDDDLPFASASRTPVDFPVDFSELRGEKHRLWVEVRNAEADTIGRTERIFKLGTAGHHAW